jgi:hypothetical protein
VGANLVAARRPFRGCAVHAQKQVRANTGGRTALPEHAHKNNFGLGEGNTADASPKRSFGSLPLPTSDYRGAARGPSVRGPHTHKR